MSSWPRPALPALLALACATAHAAPAAPPAYPGIGRPATPAELAAWDTDVRADFKGLPAGSGSVAQGQIVWEAQCASCHGVFGDSNEVFSPLAGGTSADDIRSGRVAHLADGRHPGRTTLMKLATLSTLWDYIQRAMPWTAPKSLTVDEVYAVTAYLLNLGGIVPDGFTLSNRNIAAVQQRLPNRNGMTTDHGLWPGRALGNGGRPDVRPSACMRDCEAGAAVIASALPDHARNAHGNLAQQNRLVGAQHGVDTAPAVVAAPPPATTAASAGLALARQHNCLACHGIDSKIVGPALRDVARKYAGRSDAADYLAHKIAAGSSGVWGAIAMPAQTLNAADAQAISQWLADGATP